MLVVGAEVVAVVINGDVVGADVGADVGDGRRQLFEDDVEDLDVVGRQVVRQNEADGVA